MGTYPKGCYLFIEPMLGGPVFCPWRKLARDGDSRRGEAVSLNDQNRKEGQRWTGEFLSQRSEVFFSLS
jgi:hypothetical protein